VEKGRRNGIVGAPGEVGDEIDALEGGSLICRGLDDRLNVGICADWAAEDRVARGDGRAFPSQDGVCFALEGGYSGVAEEADGGTEELGNACTGGRIG